MVDISGPTPPPPPKVPKPLPPPTQPVPPADLFQPTRRGLAGIPGTIITGPLGDLTPARTTKKSLIGGAY